MNKSTVKVGLWIMGSCLALVCLGLFLYMTTRQSPTIIFPDGTYHDFGIVDEGEVVSHNFIFRNEGKALLVIKKVKTSCGCTSANAEKWRTPAGDTSGITVTYKGRRTLKKELLCVWVETNDLKQPIVEMDLQCKVQLNVFWYPKSVSFYCEHGTNDQHKQVQFLTDSTEKFEIGEIITSSDRITASWDKNDKDIKCKISLNPTCPEGNWTDKVTIQTLVGTYKRSIEIPVYLMIQ